MVAAIKPRSITEVIRRIKACIPADVETHVSIDFINELEHLEQLMLFTAPECEVPLWNSLCWACNEYLPSPATDPFPSWAAKIGRIVRAEE